MWCPVAVRHFCKAIRSRPQEAKTGKGLMNIFLDTVGHATLVDKDDRHRDHQELKAIWSSIVGFERRLCLCMTDTLRRWAVWWKARHKAKGRGSHQPPIPGRTCKPSLAGRPGKQELASSSGKDRAVSCQIQASPLQPSYPTRKVGRMPWTAALRRTWALHPWGSGSAFCTIAMMWVRLLLAKSAAVRLRPMLDKKDQSRRRP